MNKRASMLTKGMIATAMFFGICIPISILASPMFSNAQLAKIIQTENNATVKLNSPSKLEITQVFGNGSSLRIYLVNVEGAVALRATFSGDLLTGDDVNEWNKNQTIYARIEGSDVHLQSNIFTGSIDEIGMMLPDKFIRLNYDVFIQTSKAFAKYINEKNLAHSQKSTPAVSSQDKNMKQQMESIVKQQVINDENKDKQFIENYVDTVDTFKNKFMNDLKAYPSDVKKTSKEINSLIFK